MDLESEGAIGYLKENPTAVKFSIILQTLAAGEALQIEANKKEWKADSGTKDVDITMGMEMSGTIFKIMLMTRYMIEIDKDLANEFMDSLLEITRGVGLEVGFNTEEDNVTNKAEVAAQWTIDTIKEVKSDNNSNTSRDAK